MCLDLLLVTILIGKTCSYVKRSHYEYVSNVTIYYHMSKQLIEAVSNDPAGVQTQDAMNV